MRKQIVAGNWKMNKNFREAEDFLFELKDKVREKEFDNTEIIVCPPSVYLELATDVAEESIFFVGAQNVSSFGKGAYTGEISAEMLNSMFVDYCIIGHSERRKYFNEANEVLAEKVNQLIENEISPIYCCGEVLSEREEGKHFDVNKEQIEKGLFHLNKEEFSNIIIAYEPVWAIGTGVNATPDQAQEMHGYIRSLINEKYGGDIAENTVILYGGSCKPGNAKDLFSQKDVDGGLIGGASLDVDDFLAIINSF